MPNQSIQPGPSEDVAGPVGGDRIRQDYRRPCDTTGARADTGHGASSRSGSRIMTIAGQGQPRSLGRTATAIQSLFPGYFDVIVPGRLQHAGAELGAMRSGWPLA
jgi:hypothetical protein